MDPDRDLERLFLEARAEDEQRAPSFAQVARARPVRTRSPRYRWALALAMVALIAAGVRRLTMTPNAQRVVISFAPGEMRVPTDYLLDMVPYPRAGEIPRIGASDWFPLPLTIDASPDARRFP